MINQEEILNVTTDTFVPASAAGTGTITTNGVYWSTSSSDQLKVGDYVVDATQGESRKVKTVNRAGTGGILEDAFTADLSAIALNLISKEDAKVITLGIAADQGGNTTVDGKTVTSGGSINFASTPKKSDLGLGYVKPKWVLGATTGACTALIERFRNA